MHYNQLPLDLLWVIDELLEAHINPKDSPEYWQHLENAKIGLEAFHQIYKESQC